MHPIDNVIVFFNELMIFKINLFLYSYFNIIIFICIKQSHLRRSTMKKFFYKSIAVAASTIYISFMPMSVIASSESITPAIPNHNLLNSEEVIIPDGYVLIENSSFLEPKMHYYIHGNTSDFYLSDDGEKIIGVKQLKDKSACFKLSEGVTADDINNAISELYTIANGEYLLGGRYTKTETVSWVTISGLSNEKTTQLCDSFKEKGLVTDCMILSEIQPAQEIETKWIGYYNNETYDVSNNQYIETETIIGPVVESILPGYTFTHITDRSYGVRMDYLVLVPPKGATLSEQIDAAEIIYNETGISIEAQTSYLLSEAPTVNVFNAIKYDANCDGHVSVADAVAILQNIGNKDKYPLSAQGEYNADTNYDGITAADALAIQMLDAKGKL